MRVLLFTPPMVQINTPYPATAYLTGFLRSRGIDTRQSDPSIDLVCRLFSQDGLRRVRDAIKTRWDPESPETPAALRFFFVAFEDYARTVEPVVRFLQGKDPTLAHRLASRTLVPEGPRFAQLDELPETLEGAFGPLGIQDRAKHLASLYLDDLADVLRLGVDEKFQLSRYGERLAASVPTFDALQEALLAPFTVIDEMLEEVLAPLLLEHSPDVVGMTVPFPGNVFGALRSAQIVRKHAPRAKIAFGGGYANTELRELEDPGIFDFVDFITLDDGERPLLCLLEHIEGKRPIDGLFRTYVREGGRVRLITAADQHDIPFADSGLPTYDGLPLDKYISMLEMLNPMHRLWSDLRWNKLTLAHGCYWKKCSFCDTSLDYIGRYDPAPADRILERMQKIADETGQTGFHFVDEAAPPAALRALSQRIIEKGLTFTWWGNIRFDKAFTPELAQLMADAGCVAVSGGLEVASDRLLQKMKKGVTVEQVASVTRGLREAGILVHAYLMYGFPTETEQETIDSLERVRQLFRAGCLQSAFWHRFATTVHSPVGKNPEEFGIRLLEMPVTPGRRFARNDLPFEDPEGCDHSRLGEGLKKAIFNYMHGIGLDEDVRVWFEHRVPATTVHPKFIERALRGPRAVKEDRKSKPPAEPASDPTKKASTRPVR